MRRTLSVLLVAAGAAWLFAAGAEAQVGPAPQERVLTVSGEGTVRGAPDMALITLGVVSEAPAAREALSANSRSVRTIIDALKAEGIEPRDLQTSGFSVEPVYSQPPSEDAAEPFRPEIVGYRVRNNVNLRIRDLARVGPLLDQVVTLGANSISGPTFSVENPTPLQDDARRAAVAEALRKGKLYAEAAGVALGPLLRVEEGYVQPPQPMAGDMMMRMEASPAPVPIEGGELSFQVQVSVTWRLAD